MQAQRKHSEPDLLSRIYVLYRTKRGLAPLNEIGRFYE